MRFPWSHSVIACSLIASLCSVDESHAAFQTTPSATALLLAQDMRHSRSGIEWRDAQSPFTPGIGAIIGGPGNAPETGSPMYVCRAQVQGSVTPGKWVKGNCNVAYNGSEVVMAQYQVAYGNALWQPYSASFYGLIRTGTDSDGTPLFSCRVHYDPGFPQGDQGNQPGKLLNGTCRIPYGGGELVINPPFQALYPEGAYPPYPPPYPYPPYSPYPPPLPPQPAYPTPNPSTVTWRAARGGGQPGPGAIEGGPGYGPEPDAPLYICRAGDNYYGGGGLYPGKWVQGKCSIALDGRELKENVFDVAYGSATWGSFGGMITPDMVVGGVDKDQTPLYICRVPHFKPAFSEKGNQPGYLNGGVCFVPYGSGTTNNPPFEVLFNAPSGSGGTATSSAPAPLGLLVSFDSGTSAAAGTIVVTNGATGKIVSRQLAPNMTAAACLEVLQQAAFEAGLQIQSDPKGLKLAGSNNTVQVTGANVTMTPY